MNIDTARRSRLMKASGATAFLACLSVVSALPTRAAEETDLWQRETFTGDWGGSRTALSERGIDIAINYIGEALGTLSGGFRQGTSFENRFEFSLDGNLGGGASAHVTVYVIGQANGLIAADYVGSIADPSNFEALPSTRLFTAWFQKNAFDDKLSIRVGQLAADDEFFTSPTAGGLINSTFGYATLLAADQTHGGPVYPLATPAIRIQFAPSDEFSILGAVFAGAPAGSDCVDAPQICNRYGTTFSTSGGAQWMGELQFGRNLAKDAMGLPGIYKLGGWYATADFADQHLGLDAGGSPVSLASPAVVSSLDREGNWGFYGIADQMIWRAANGPRSVNFFLRAGASPKDRNLVSSYIDGGIGIAALFPGREDDVLTFGIGYTKISPDAAALDADTQFFTGAFYPARSEEVAFELDYALQIAPWWVVQLDAQYIASPGGNVPDPFDATKTIGDAFVIGARTSINF